MAWVNILNEPTSSAIEINLTTCVICALPWRMISTGSRSYMCL